MVSDETIIKVTAIICLTIICSIALTKGIDSTLIATVSAIIGGIAGYTIKKLKYTKQKTSQVA